MATLIYLHQKVKENRRGKIAEIDESMLARSKYGNGSQKSKYGFSAESAEIIKLSVLLKLVPRKVGLISSDCWHLMNIYQDYFQNIILMIIIKLAILTILLILTILMPILRILNPFDFASSSI